MRDLKTSGIRSALSRTGVYLWYRLPVGRMSKEKIKSIMFYALPVVFKHTRVYKNWQYTKKLQRARTDFVLSDVPPSWPLSQVSPDEFQTKFAGDQNKTLTKGHTPLAIIIHAFHDDVFASLLDYLMVFKNKPCKMFIGTTREKRKAIRDMLQGKGFDYELQTFENRGRDILPFLQLSRQAISEGYPLILKLHTKRSDHRLSGQLWFQEICDSLLQSEAVDRILAVFREHDKVGLLGPAGHIVPMNLYYGGNAFAIAYLCHRLQFDTQKLQEMHFAAGSMFYIRSAALKPLLALELTPDMFEEEMGQHDGTLAHAVERIFAVSNYQAGFGLADSTSTPEQIRARVTKDHAFTW